MKIALQSPARKRLTVAIALVAAGAYLGLVGRDLAASWFGSRPELKSLQRAAWLDPTNADYRYHVGRYYDLVARDPASAITHYKAAVQLNPHSARYWFDLASAYQVMGDTTNQTAALERAIQADSMTPDVAWEAANLYLVQGENEKALKEFRAVLANDTSLANVAIRYCWRIAPDVDLLLRDVVPSNAEAYIAFLSMLQADVAIAARDLASPPDGADLNSLRLKIDNETPASFKVWNALMESRQTFESRYAYDYFGFLIAFKRVDEALQVWQQTVDRFGLSAYLPSPGNMIVNGNFGFDPINAGLDWQFKKLSSVKLTLDPTVYHSGRRSLLINFDGPGINDAGVYQLVPVQPNTAYDISAYYKSGETEGAGGPHLTIQDMYNQAIYYESDELKDADFWKSVSGEFTTGPDCKLVMLHVRRLPAGMPFRGRLWVDDFRIVRKPS